MKENKTARMEIRLTPAEKEKLKQYAEKHNMTVSETIRDLCYKIFNENKEEK